MNYDINKIRNYVKSWYNRTHEQIEQDNKNFEDLQYNHFFKKRFETGADFNKQNSTIEIEIKNND